MKNTLPVCEISKFIWDLKYRLKSEENQLDESCIEETWRRVAKNCASVEKNKDFWESVFYSAMEDFKLIPGGRILASVGRDTNTTLVNTFFMGKIIDDFEQIFNALSESAMTLRFGGGIGCDFSLIRPRNEQIVGLNAKASGSIPFMHLWDQMCSTVMSGGIKRGAMMALLHCSHPDIEEFIFAKKNRNSLKHFNLSVIITDHFMEAVVNNQPWNLTFEGKIYKTINANKLFEKILRSTYKYSEPGIVFIDRVNNDNKLKYCEKISGTNSCGEQPLPYYGSAPLASINLASIISNPFTNFAQIDLKKFELAIYAGIRLLDNVLDISKYPLDKQRIESKEKRRIGLGITGLADALIMCNEVYGSESSINLIDKWLEFFEEKSYSASSEIAAEKGSFPKFDSEEYTSHRRVKKLKKNLISKIKKHGIRNAVLNCVAPTGSTSLLAGNVSSGIEPVFAFSLERIIKIKNKSKMKFRMTDYAYDRFTKFNKVNMTTFPKAFLTSTNLSSENHLKVQSTVQKYIDGSISKTINCPKDMSFDDFKNVYLNAYKLNCKGCTTYKPSKLRGYVLKEE